LAETYQISERNVSELGALLQALIRVLLDGDEPLLCFEFTENHANPAVYALVATESELFKLVSYPKASQPYAKVESIIFLNEVTFIDFGKSYDGQIELHMTDRNYIHIPFVKQQEQTWYKFLARLRKAISKSKKAG
jgi:hypothetical protein